jgi:hypothetical protein
MFKPLRFFTHHWVHGGLSVSLLPFLLVLVTWFLYLLEPECIDGDTCSVLGGIISSLFSMALGGFFLVILPMTAPIARVLPSVSEGNFILGVMFILLIGNFVLGAWIASTKADHLLSLARQKKWFFPGIVAVWLLGSMAIASTYQVLYKNPWLSAAAVCIAWALYIFYVLMCVMAGEYLLHRSKRMAVMAPKGV